MSSCSKYQRLLKSTDMDAKYEAAVNYFNKGEYYRSLTLLDELIAIFRGTSKAEDVYYYYSYCYFHNGEYNVAAYHFKNYYTTFPLGKKAEECLFMNAYCYYLASPISTLDQTNSFEAINQLQFFINRFPQSERVEESNRLIDELRSKLEQKSFDNSKLYYLTGDYRSAMVALENVINDFPGTGFEEECRFLILKSSYLFADNSVEDKKLDRFKESIENYYKFVAGFGEGKYAKEAEKMFLDAEAYISSQTEESTLLNVTN